MKQPKGLSLDELTPTGRDTAAERESNEAGATGKVDGRTLRRTGRTVQTMWRTSPAYQQDVLAIAEAMDWTIGETLERAVDELKKKLKWKAQ
jgi:hypothetical protein